MHESKDPRVVAQQEIEETLQSLDVGLPGTDRRREWHRDQQWVSDSRKRQEARKERRIASVAGIGYGVLGTAVTAGVSWLTGAGQWLLSILTSRR